MWWGNIIPEQNQIDWNLNQIAKDIIEWLSSWF